MSNNMITILNERIFKVSSENFMGNSKLTESDIIFYVKKILAERDEMPKKVELKFIY